MANLVKRRVPLRIIRPIQAQPAPIVARIPKIRTILRASVITAGVVVSIRNPHASAAISSKVPKPNVITTPARPRYNGYVESVTSPKNNLPRATKGKINVIGNTFKRGGFSFRIASPLANLPRVKPFNSRVIGTSFRRDGSVIKISSRRSTIPNIRFISSKVVQTSYNRLGSIIKVRNPLNLGSLATTRPKSPKVISSTYRRDGKVYTSRHSNTVVIPVTSVRPKILKVIPDIRDSYRRLYLPGRVSKAGPSYHPIVLQTFVAILASLNLTETWDTHFTSRGWASPQAQIDAGYPLYCEPTAINGSYEEVVDYGLEIDNTIVTVRYAQNLLIGNVNIVIKIATSLDGITYSAFTTGSSLFSPAMRFVKYRLEFTANDDKSLVEITNLEYLIDIKTELDSGTITANAGDIGGTQVNFNKTFKSIDSITLAVAAQEPVTPIYQFTAVPNPTHFFVYALDSSGNRTTYPVSWKARGVV